MTELNNKKYYPKLHHGPIKEVLPNIFTVKGTMRLYGLFQYSRVMTLIKSGNEISILHPVRVDKNMLEEIKKLGEIKHILKIGQLHSVDLPFYMDNFAANLWSNKGDPSVGSYKPSGFFEDYTDLPFLDAQVRVIKDSKVKESILITNPDKGCLHSCDAFVNMGRDSHHNWLTAQLSKLLPNPTYIGPNWVKVAKPPEESMKGVLDYEFENFIPAHGDPIIGEAKLKLKSYLDCFYS